MRREESFHDNMEQGRNTVGSGLLFMQLES
jgi:hypothetical protein